MKKCAKCKNENPDIAQFCMVCGSTLEINKKKCPQCSTENPETAKHCMTCGKSLSNIHEPAIPTDKKYSDSTIDYQQPTKKARETNEGYKENKVIKRAGSMLLRTKEDFVIVATCDICNKDIKIEKYKCIWMNNKYTIKPPVRCTCGAFLDEIYVEKNMMNTIKNNQHEEMKKSSSVTCSIITFIVLAIVFILILRGCIGSSFSKQSEPTISPSEIRATQTQQYFSAYSSAGGNQIVSWEQKCEELTDAQRTHNKPMTSLVGAEVEWGGTVIEVKSSDDTGILESLVNVGIIALDVVTNSTTNLEGETTYKALLRMGSGKLVYVRNIPEDIALKLSDNDNLVFNGVVIENGLDDQSCDFGDVLFLSLKE
jgi:hypothetical protein